ncbi:MAG: energy transducer TonB [Ekhidna sp.]|nr:energy transducer TonB [Ekhidna sp.]
MKNRVEIVDQSIFLSQDRPKPDFKGVLDQYNDYQKLRRKYYWSGTLLLVAASLMGFLLYPDSNEDNQSNVNEFYAQVGPVQSNVTQAINSLSIPVLQENDAIGESRNYKKKKVVTEPLQEKEALFTEEVPSTPLLNASAKPLDGFVALYQYFDEKLQYPDSMLMDSVEGVVKVAFTISADSSISHIEVFESLGEAFDKEAVRLVNEMPKWTPAIKDNQPVSSSMIIPVRFKITRDE